MFFCNILHRYAGGIVDGEVKSLASSDSTLIIGTNNSFSFSTDDGAFHRVGACVTLKSAAPNFFTPFSRSYEGLSMNNVTSLATLVTNEGTQVIAGTSSGIVLGSFLQSRPQAPPPHRYFNGPRWLPARSAEAGDNAVLHLAAFTGKGWSKGISGGGGGVWCVTRQGVSLLEAVPMTLNKKSDYLQAILFAAARCSSFHTHVMT